MHCCCRLLTYQHMLRIVVYTIHTSTHAKYCCCTLLTHQHMLCIVAVHYSHVNTCYALLLYTTHTSRHAMYCCCTQHTYQHMLCIVAVVDSSHAHNVVLYKYQNIPYLAAIVDYIHTGSATASHDHYSRYLNSGVATPTLGHINS